MKLPEATLSYEHEGMIVRRERVKTRNPISGRFRYPYAYWVTEPGKPEMTLDWIARKYDIPYTNLRIRCERLLNGDGHIETLLAPYRPTGAPQILPLVNPRDMVSQEWKIALSLGVTLSGIKSMSPVDIRDGEPKY